MMEFLESMGGVRHGCLGRRHLCFDREPQGDVESAQLHGFKLGTDRSDKNCMQCHSTMLMSAVVAFIYAFKVR